MLTLSLENQYNHNLDDIFITDYEIQISLELPRKVCFNLKKNVINFNILEYRQGT